MIVKRTYFNKEAANFNVTTRRISNGFVVSGHGRQEVHKPAEEEALALHEQYVEELAEELRVNITQQIEQTAQRLADLKTASENFDDWVAEAQDEADQQYQQYRKNQKQNNS